MMRVYIQDLHGLNVQQSPRQIQDTELIEAVNVVYKNNKVIRRAGYERLASMGTIGSPIIDIIYFDQFSQTQHAHLVMTTTDILAWDDTNQKWLYCNPIYTTGTVSASGTTVTGSGVCFTQVQPGDTIRFQTTDPNSSSGSQWYTITSVGTPKTSCTIDTSVSYSSVSYCIKKSFSFAQPSWTIATLSDGTRALVYTDGVHLYYWNAVVTQSKMLTKAYYTTGTVSCTSGTTTVTLSGGNWTGIDASNLYVCIGTTNPQTASHIYRVASINSGTQLTIADAAVQTYSNASYALFFREQCRYVGFFGSASGNHLLIGDVTEGTTRMPFSISISAVGDPADFSAGEYIDLMETNDAIKGFKKIRDAVAVYKEFSISLLTPTYSPDVLFRVQENVVGGIGTLTIRSVCEVDAMHIFLGNDDVYVFDGVHIQAIGTKIRDRIFPRLNYESVSAIFAYYDRATHLYMLFVPVDGSEWCNECYVYDTTQDSWSVFTFAHTITALRDVVVDMAYTWAQAPSHEWEYYRTRGKLWTDFLGGARSRMVWYGDVSGNVYQGYAPSDDGYPIPAHIVTKDYPLNEPYQLATLGDVRLYIARSTGSIKVSCSANYGFEWSEEKIVDMNGVAPIIEKTVSFAQRGNFFRFTIANVSGSYFELESFAIGFNPSGE